MARRRVVMLLRYIPQYRLPFLTRLHEKCIGANIDLKVIYGTPAKNDSMKADGIDFQPGLFIPNRIVPFGQSELIWQPVLSHTQDADLVIVEQQSKLLVNYILIAQQLFGRQRVAFFGHGRNLQAKSVNSLAEAVKRRLALLPHWWFAYTEGVARYVREIGYPADRITVFNNAVDTRQLIRWRSEIADAELVDARSQLNIKSNNVCVYVGSMYPDKRMEFLLDACGRIRTRIPDFCMLFIGAGPDDYLVRQFCADHPWARYLGPLFGREKVKFCLLAQLLLMPGAVGLAVLDAFAIRTPLVTTDVPFHGPEIEYLTSGSNGLTTAPADDVDRYASAVVSLLADRVRLGQMAQACEKSAAYFTIESMAERFFHGIEHALSWPIGYLTSRTEHQ
jgi:glycosyltransferase involved in cell wall biosynthesis